MSGARKACSESFSKSCENSEAAGLTDGPVTALARKNLGDAFGVPLFDFVLTFLMLLFLLCLFLGCHCFYSPFHFSWKNLQRMFCCNLFNCIELLKNEVKKKMNAGSERCCTKVTRGRRSRRNFNRSLSKISPENVSGMRSQAMKTVPKFCRADRSCLHELDRIPASLTHRSSSFFLAAHL